MVNEREIIKEKWYNEKQAEERKEQKEIMKKERRAARK